MRNLHVLLLVLALGLASGQTAPAEVRDTSLNMLGPLLSLAAKQHLQGTAGIWRRVRSNCD